MNDDDSSDKLQADLNDAFVRLRHFAGSMVIFALLSSGVADLLAKSRYSLDRLADMGKWDCARLRALLEFGWKEGLVGVVEGEYYATAELERCLRLRGWFELMVGGYGNIFLQLGTALRRSPRSRHPKILHRNGRYVGRGSCNMSKYGAFRLINELIERSSNNVREIVIADLGCGDAAGLVDFCSRRPDSFGVAVEPDKAAFLAAKALIRSQQLSHRISTVNCSCADFLRKRFVHDPPSHLVLSFVLHEILGTRGEKGVTGFLSAIRRRFPRCAIVVVEVDESFTKEQLRDSQIGLGYYNAYLLLHTFTGQQLMPASFWMTLFERCGYDVATTKAIPAAADPLGAEKGFLLLPR